MMQNLVRLIHYRELLWNLALGEFKARHRQTFLGVAWALVQPITMMLIFTIVFSVFAKVSVQGTSYVLFAYTGVVSWMFLASSLSAGLPSIVSSMNLVTKVGFPREVIPLSKLLTTGFDFLVGMGVLTLLLLVYEAPISSVLFVVPCIAVIQLVFIVGLVLLGSALYVLKRDLGTMLPLLIQIWMFLSPVVYPISLIPERYRTLYMLNPMASILEAYRNPILFGVSPSLETVAHALIAAAVLLVVGYAYFKSVEAQFADTM